METKKSHDLSCISQKVRKAGGIIQPESKGLKTRWADVRRRISQLKQREHILSSSSFCSIQALNRLDDAYSNLSFLLGLDTNASLSQEHPHRHTKSYSFPSYLCILCRVKLTFKINHNICQ